MTLSLTTLASSSAALRLRRLVTIAAAALIALASVAPDADARRKKYKRHHRAAKAAAAVTAPAPKPLKAMTRHQILQVDADRLERVGRHLMIGYHSFAEAKALVEKRAIAGIFLTDHNVRRRPATATAAEVSELQAIRADQGLPPLLVAADQEGGAVSRLSPPLQKQPRLAAVLKRDSDQAAHEAAVRAYATTQARELKRIGVTMNFSPVVDLNTNPGFRGDGATQLRNRAISADPDLVARVAGWYCDSLAAEGLLCTLKHFPGLGRAKRDTHRTSAEIRATETELALTDWVPFQRALSRPNVALMMAHVHLPAIDKTAPASCSDAIIDKIIRERWRHDGLIITDDFSMGAITRSADGVGPAAVKALNAGADIVLVSWSERHLNAVLTALIDADVKGTLNTAKTKTSAARTKRIIESQKVAADHGMLPEALKN